MGITFTLEQLLNVFAKYNQTFWPLQVLAATFLTFKRSKYSSRSISGILAILWLWTGAVFYMFYFGPIYTPAYAFGGLYILQGILFLANTFQPRLSFTAQGRRNAIIGLVTCDGMS